MSSSNAIHGIGCQQNLNVLSHSPSTIHSVIQLWDLMTAYQDVVRRIETAHLVRTTAGVIPNDTAPTKGLAVEPRWGSSRRPPRGRWDHASTRCRYMDVGASNYTQNSYTRLSADDLEAVPATRAMGRPGWNQLYPCFGTRKTIGVKRVHLITNALAVRRR